MACRNQVSGIAEQKQLQEVFNALDPHHTGKIALKDVPVAIRALGKCPTEAQIQEITGTCGDKVDFDTLCNLYRTKLPKTTDLEPEIRAVFSALDLSGNGTIREVELRKLLAEGGEPLSSDELEHIIRIACHDDSGLIQYDRFATVLIS